VTVAQWLPSGRELFLASVFIHPTKITLDSFPFNRTIHTRLYLFQHVINFNKNFAIFSLFKLPMFWIVSILPQVCFAVRCGLGRPARLIDSLAEPQHASGQNAVAVNQLRAHLHLLFSLSHFFFSLSLSTPSSPFCLPLLSSVSSFLLHSVVLNSFPLNAPLPLSFIP